MKEHISRLYPFFKHFHDFKWRLAFKAVLTGAAAGLLAIIYRLTTEKGTEFAAHLYGITRQHPFWIIAWVLAALAVGLLIAYMIKKEPMASGGGVPQVEGIVRYGLKMRWLVVIVVRYVAGILGSLFGLSFGPEGPSVQLGAAINQGISTRFSKTKLEEKYLETAGAAAGLSAAFSAPLTGTLFALEEIHRNFSPLVFLSAIAASLSSDFISKFFFGLKPVVYFQSIPQLPLQQYFWLLPLGVFAGLAGVLTNKGMLFTQTLFNRFPTKMRSFISLLIAIVCGLFLPQVLGGGHDLVNIVGMQYTLHMLVLLFIVKLVFSCTSIGSGTPGGIFMPIIAISALSGSLFASLAGHIGLASSLTPVIIICAMAGGLTACVKAPVTSIVLVIEMTSSFLHILPVAICTFIALFLSDLLHTAPIYEAFLNRYIHKNGYTTTCDKCGEIIEQVVEYGSKVVNKHIKEITWPKGALIVGLSRGDDEIIPDGNTLILPGDYLLIMLPRGRSNEIKRTLRQFCVTK